MKILNWNVNGLRSIIKKDFIIDNKSKSGNTFESYIKNENPDFICLNETKLSDPVSFMANEYPHQYFTQCCVKKGYSGVAILSKHKPITQIADTISSGEGRLICLEFKKFYLINIYAPNSGPKLDRLSFKLDWINKLYTFIDTLIKSGKEVLITGDYNIAPIEIDLANPSAHGKSAGFTDSERNAFIKLTSIGLTDIWRHINPYTIEFTYFDYRTKARSRNIGWRIDHFLLTKKLVKKSTNCTIRKNIYGSDHLPIVLEIDLKSYQI